MMTARLLGASAALLALTYRRRPLGWGVWYQDVPDTGGDRYYTSVVFTEFTRQCFVSPPGNWKFHYEPSEGVEFTVFVQ